MRFLYVLYITDRYLHTYSYSNDSYDDSYDERCNEEQKQIEIACSRFVTLGNNAGHSRAVTLSSVFLRFPQNTGRYYSKQAHSCKRQTTCRLAAAEWPLDWPRLSPERPIGLNLHCTFARADVPETFHKER